jgi:tetratricopeptide (TPR) repeat protein
VARTDAVDRLNALFFGKEAATGRNLAKVSILCAAVAVVVALPSLINGFVYDDVWIVESNEVVHNLDVGELLSSPFWPEDRGGVMWRPVALVAFALQWAVGGGAPFLFHLGSVLLYGLVAGAAGLVLARMFSPGLGLLAGIVFAIHPAHVEVTANAVGQAELWAALGFLGALWATWERSGSTAKRVRLGLLLAVVACLILGLGGKEQPVTFPAAAVALWWLRARNDGSSTLSVAKREWLVPAVSCVLIAAYLWLRAEFGGGVTAAGGIATGLDSESALQRLVVMLPVTITWLRVLFVPIALSADYSPQHLVPEVVFGAKHAGALLLWVGLIGLTLLVRNTQRAVFVGVLLFAITISVVSNVLVPLEVLMAERLLFLPSLGWALAVAGLLSAAYSGLAEPRQQRLLVVAVGVVIVLFAGRSIQRATVWRNSDIFFAKLVEDAPDSFRSHWATGHFAFERGDSAAGERELQTAVRLNPEHPQLLEDLGRLYAASGHYEPAIPLLSHAVEIDSTRLSSALPLALALTRIERSADALKVLDNMSILHGETRGITLVRGEVLVRIGDFQAAVEALVGLIQREPNVWSIRQMAAEAALQAGLCEVALAQADTALILAPDADRAAVEAFKSTVANGNNDCISP